MKSKQVIDTVKQDAWVGSEGTHEDKPLLIRFREGFRHVTDLTGYPTLLQIVWSFDSDDTGLPSDADPTRWSGLRIESWPLMNMTSTPS